MTPFRTFLLLALWLLAFPVYGQTNSNSTNISGTVTGDIVGYYHTNGTVRFYFRNLTSPKAVNCYPAHLADQQFQILRSVAAYDGFYVTVSITNYYNYRGNVWCLWRKWSLLRYTNLLSPPACVDSLRTCNQYFQLCDPGNCGGSLGAGTPSAGVFYSIKGETYTPTNRMEGKTTE